MKRDPLHELFTIGRMSSDRMVEKMLHEWAQRYVHTSSVREYSSRDGRYDADGLQKHIEEKTIHQLAALAIRDMAMDSFDETDTANIRTKTMMFLGEKK